VLIVRPKIAELVFQVYGRSLHPELFEVYQSRQIERGAYKANVQITSAGHVVCWQYQGLTLTEIAAAANQPLPEKRRLMSHRVAAERKERIGCRGGIVYEAEFSRESMDAQLFHAFQQELTMEGTREGMLQKFDPSGRIGLGAMSYINVRSRDRSLLVQALHTFPDDFAIVKSQSLFRLP
jgi:hypothetical protein